jgi:outer membrane receptor protein involved in Fe transport
VGEDVTVSVEGRYAKDSPVQRAPNGITAETNYYSFTPRVAVSWQAAEDVNLYGLVAKGNKPGGFFFGYFDAPVTRAATELALANGKAIIKEENAWTYEVGAKTQWLDRRLTANVSVFYIDWKNQAINEVDNIDWACPDTALATAIPNNFIKNAGKSQVYGTEIELSLAATDNLLLTLSYGLQKTELLEYSSTQLAALTVNPAEPGISPAERALRELLLIQGVSVSGNEAPRVPLNTVTASATYRRPLGDRNAEWFVRGDYVYNSKTWLDAENLTYVGDLNLLNGRIGLQKDSWTASFYVDNVLNDDTPLLATQFPNFKEFPTGLDTGYAIPSAFHVVPRRERNAGVSITLTF